MRSSIVRHVTLLLTSYIIRSCYAKVILQRYCKLWNAEQRHCANAPFSTIVFLSKFLFCWWKCQCLSWYL